MWGSAIASFFMCAGFIGTIININNGSNNNNYYNFNQQSSSSLS